VKAHMTAIMRKLDVRNRTQAALVARSLGLDLAH
jgi:DNA-binding NarL/FixJ family response regulator